jgi:hypothetical protein
VPRVHVPVIRWTGVVRMWCASSLLDGEVFFGVAALPRGGEATQNPNSKQNMTTESPVRGVPRRDVARPSLRQAQSLPKGRPRHFHAPRPLVGPPTLPRLVYRRFFLEK